MRMKLIVVTVCAAALAACTSGSEGAGRKERAVRAEQARREAVFRAYVASVNAHDVAKTLSYYAPDAEFVIPGQAPIRGRAALRSLTQWDSVLGGRMRMPIARWAGDTLIAGAGGERNEWFRGIGMDTVRYAPGTRIVFEGDRIKGIYPLSFDSASTAEFQARAAAFFAWATSHAPEVARLAPGGRFRYDARSAAAWLVVMRRYAAARHSR